MRKCLWLAMLATCALPLAGAVATAGGPDVDSRCAVFSSVQERAQCACALEQGGWVTKVHGRWRWIYPRRHQERHCHAQASRG